MSPDDLRERNIQAGLAPGDLADDPVDQFRAWLQDAVDHAPGQWFDPTAMTLATGRPGGGTSAHTVLLKQVDSAGFVFYTNYQSPKAQQLEQCGQAALVFHWPYVARQVRVEGQVARVSRTESEAYFGSRPRGSQLGAIASPQSSVVADRDELESRFADLDRQFSNQRIPLPDTWGGYRLAADRIEFWQGRPDRLHDRFEYAREGEGWNRQRLAP